jgi:hypothetical protein
MPVCLILVWLMCAVAQAQGEGDRLDGLRASLAGLRQHAREHRETRGATAELTAIKHRLRDLVEARLTTFGETADEDALNRELQETLGNAGLFCPDGCVESALGYIDQVRVRRQHDLLTVQTSVGIQCGFDDSAYVYEWSRGRGTPSSVGRWRRIFETEQNNYTPTGYLPQTIYPIQISQPGKDASRLVLSLGSKPGCASAFQPLYYRIWRISGGGGKAKVLLDSSEVAYMGAYPPVRGTVLPEDVRIEFTAGGTGYGEGHQAVRHFEVRADGVKQVEPIAPTPRDFVEEWLSAPWKQIANWSESVSLESWHSKLHRDDGRGDFPDPPVACRNEPDLWEIGIRLHGVEGETYYLVRWRQPDHFMMVAIGDGPLCG